MKKPIKLGVILILAFGIIVGCSNKDGNDSNKKDKATSSKVTEDNGTDNKSKDNGSDNISENDEQSSGDVEAKNKWDMKIGDSAGYHDVIGNFQVTMKSAKFMSEIKGKKSRKGSYVVVDVKVKNIGDKSFDVGDIFSPVLSSGKIDEDGKVVADISGLFVPEIDSLIQNSKEIKPGSSQEGELVFDIAESDTYILYFENDYEEAEGNASWKFTADEIK